MPNKIDEKKLDKELKDTFPASDPTSGNQFVGAPDDKELQEKNDTHKGVKTKSSS